MDMKLQTDNFLSFHIKNYPKIFTFASESMLQLNSILLYVKCQNFIIVQ